jgi:outer membrane protein, heavy metal efflux system
MLLPRTGLAQAMELTLERSLELARGRAPAIRTARGRVADARGAVARASALLSTNPTLDIAAGPRRTPAGNDGLNTQVGLSQMFELGGKQGARREAADAALAGAEALLQDAERMALGEVASAFVRALHARERVRFAGMATAAAEEVSRSTQRRLQAGDVPVVDANVARIALSRARADAAAAEGQAAVGLSELRRLLDLRADQPLLLSGDLAALARAALPAKASETRADITALEAELREARSALRQGNAEAWPDVTLGVQYEREGEDQAILGALSLPLPLYQRGQDLRVTARAQIERLTSQLEAARSGRRIEIEAATALHAKNLQALEELRAALPLVEENLSLARKSYEAGEMGLAELLLIRREALEARTDHLDHLLQAALSRINILVQTGAIQ